MIWRWPTSSKASGVSGRFRSLPLLCLALVLCPLAAAVKGHVDLVNSRLKKQADFSGVVISLRPLHAAPQGPPRHLRMLQKNKSFQPHVLAAEVGSFVDFPNADPIFHNAFSSYSGQIFDIGLYPPGKSRSVRFERPGVVRVFCNIHQAMSAIIVVVDSPYLATTDAHGDFSIAAPPGDYELRVYHERSTEETLRALDRPLHVGDGELPLPVIHVSEAGYLPSPHKNKHGQDYPPLANDRSVYPGVRN